MITAQLILDACSCAVLAVQPQSGLIIAANHECERLLGYSVRALEGMPLSELEVSLHDLFFWQEARLSGHYESRSVYSEYRHRDGHLIDVQKSIHGVEMEGEKACVITLIDVRASKRLEDDMARTSSLLASTLESTHDGILVTDLDGEIRNFNHRFNQIWHWRYERGTTGKDLFAMMAEQQTDPQAFSLWIQSLFADPYQDGQIECRLADGRVFALASTPQRLQQQPLGRLFTFHDISELKRTELQLREATATAQSASRAKSEFLSHISHEFRTPLNAILGFAQLLEAESYPTGKELGGYISRAGRHLLELINEILDLSSIEAGRLKLSIETVDMAGIVQDCCELTRQLAHEREVSLRSPDLETGRYRVQADPRRLKQMLLNLLSNAIKYNQPGGLVEISLSEIDGGYCRLLVKDTGIGIADQDQSELFQPFTRVGNEQGHIEGSGIGLAFTRKLARLMRGDVGMLSKLGMGSQFWIDLPGIGTADGNRNLPPAERKLLYIEDDLLSRHLLLKARERKRSDYQIIEASNGKDGVEKANLEQPDIVLLDMNLPDATGLAILQTLRAQDGTRNIPVIAVSGETSHEEVQLALEHGFDAYLTKPLDLESVFDTVDRVLGSSRRLQGFEI